jgi:hypothetical protein
MEHLSLGYLWRKPRKMSNFFTDHLYVRLPSVLSLSPFGNNDAVILLGYKDWAVNIAYVVLLWIGFVSTFASYVFLASSDKHD